MGFLNKLFGGTDKKEPVEARNLMTIQVGDIINYFAESYEVFAVVEWMEEGYSWKEYKLKNKGEDFWISAEVDDGEVCAGFYKVIKDLEVGNPPGKTLTYQNKTFTLEEKGQAIGQLTSKAGTQNYQCHYYEYQTSTEKEFLSVEDYGGELEVSIGEELKSSEIDILPGG